MHWSIEKSIFYIQSKNFHSSNSAYIRAQLFTENNGITFRSENKLEVLFLEVI